MYNLCWGSAGGNVHHPAPLVNTLRAPTAEASEASGASGLKLSSIFQIALCTKRHILIWKQLERSQQWNSWSFVKWWWRRSVRSYQETQSSYPRLKTPAESKCTQGTCGGSESADLIGGLGAKGSSQSGDTRHGLWGPWWPSINGYFWPKACAGVCCSALLLFPSLFLCVILL